jgi:hypothetical protein
LLGRRHTQALELAAGLDLACGPPAVHRFNGRGFIPQGELTDSGLETYWGSRVAALHHVARRKFNASGLDLRPSASGVMWHIGSDQIIGLTPAVVSFTAMQGKYDGHNELVWWHELPKAIAPGAHHRQWWPVVAVEFDTPTRRFLMEYEPPAEDDGVFGGDDGGSSSSSPEAGGRRLWIVCVYKLFWKVPVAWPIRLRAR